MYNIDTQSAFKLFSRRKNFVNLKTRLYQKSKAKEFEFSSWRAHVSFITLISFTMPKISQDTEFEYHNKKFDKQHYK